MQKNSKPSRALYALPWALSISLLAGCGGGGGTSSTTPAPSTSTTPVAVTQALTVDFASLANYAAPVLPAYYDATAHAMRLGNSRYYRPGDTFWDRRADSLEAQASQPIQNAIEMGFDATHGGFAAVITKLQNLSYYPALFSFAFGDATITEARVQRALAQFERAMVSTSSRWDAGYSANYAPAAPDRGLGTAIATFTAEENQGRALFMNPPNAGGAGCVGCHVAPTFSLAANSRSNGLDAGETTVFKSPSLKNVALSGAFMHDGRFATLADVVEHYNSGVQAGPALDNRLIGPGGQPRRLNLSTAQKAALVAFMQTLTDTALVADAKFSTPFR
jgi:cytochrome c peroxidase